MIFFNFLFTINKLEYLEYIVPHNTSKNLDQFRESYSHLGACTITGNDASSDDKEVFFDCEQFSDDQYFNCNGEDYNLVKNSKILQYLQDKKTIALALYNHPGFDTIKFTDKQESKKTNDIQFKLKKFELNEDGYIAELENGNEIMKIAGKTAYIVTPYFMNSKINRRKDTGVNVDSEILGCGNGNQAVRFNVIVVFDAAIEIDNLFEVKGSGLNLTTLLKKKILSVVKEYGASAGYHIGSEQKNYTKFVVGDEKAPKDVNTLKIVVKREDAINYYAEKVEWINLVMKSIPDRLKLPLIEEGYDTLVAAVLGKSCVQKEDLELDLTQKDTFISGAVLNKVQDVVRNTARIEVLAGNGVNPLEEKVKPPKGEEARSNVKPLEAKDEQSESDKVRRREYLKKKFKHAVDAFGKAGTRFNYPKEQQLSIDLGNKPVFGIVSKILHWIENKFKYFFPRYNLFPEVGNEDRKIPGTNSQVKYFTPEEQAEHSMYLGEEEGGEIRLYNVKGELYDTTDTDKVSKGKKGYVAYVITIDGRLITHEHVNVGENKYAYRHSTLACGEPVLCSGLMIVKNGKIEYIDNNSGHYKPGSANIYNAIIRFKASFSQNAKVVHFGGWFGFIKEIPILCRIVPGKKESIDGFQQRMEKKGKSGLTKFEECFKKIREYNKHYEQKLFFESYKSPTSEPPNNPAIHKKHKVKLSSYIKHCKFFKDFDENYEVRRITVEHSIRKIIGANFGRKPRIELAKKRVGKLEEVGVNVIFYHEDDHEKFVKLLDCKGYHYTSLTIQEKFFCRGENAPKYIVKYIVFIDEISFNKFIKNTLEIDRSTGTILSDLELLCEESNSRTI